MEIKNIVIINDFNYIQGGASKVAIDTANLLSETNSDLNVYFFSAVKGKEKALNESIKDVCLNVVEALRDKNRLRGFFNGLYNRNASRELKLFLKTLKKEETVIHVHGWTKALSCSIFKVLFKEDFKVVLTCHDYFSFCPNGGYFNYKKNCVCNCKPLSFNCIKCNCDSRNYFFKIYRVLRQFIQNRIVGLNSKIKYVIGISDLNIKVLKKEFDKNVKIEKIYNPIKFEYNEIKSIEKEEYYLYVGRLAKEKGVDIFCDALTQLELRGIVVGDGPEMQRLKNKYPKIEFVGWKNSIDVEKYMKHAKCLIFPSLWYEGAPLTPLEAISYNTPCLISDLCSAREYVDKKFCFSNIEELKEKIIKDDFDDFDFSILSNYSEKKYVKEIMGVYKRKELK